MTYSDRQPETWAEAKPAFDSEDLPDAGADRALSWGALALVVIVLAAAASLIVGGALYGMF